jgi:hypothetical protein
MAKADVVINRRRSSVWEAFIDAKTWQHWWADVRSIEPSWKPGAKIVWAQGPPSTILELKAEKLVQLQSVWMEYTFRFSDRGNDTTVITVDFKARGGAAFTDGGAAEQAATATSLAKLKEIVELQPSSRNTAISRRWWQFWS